MKEKRPVIGAITAIVLMCVCFGIVGYQRSVQTTECPSELNTEPYSDENAEVDKLIASELKSENRAILTALRAIETETTAEETTTPPTTQAETTTERITEAHYEYDPDPEYTGSYIGYFELTAYEWTGERMANGEYPYYGACACNSLPLGTQIYIDGHGYFTVCDRGGMADNVIDIYLGDYDACVQFGRQSAEVYYG